MRLVVVFVIGLLPAFALAQSNTTSSQSTNRSNTYGGSSAYSGSYSGGSAYGGSAMPVVTGTTTSQEAQQNRGGNYGYGATPQQVR